jgi:hypothetical protein
VPGSAIAELILQPIVEAVLQIAGYLTARVVVPLFTLGTVVVEPLGWQTKVHPKLRWPRLTGRHPRVLDGEFASLLGLVFWAMVAVVVYFTNEAP